jgi:hypothetical protein
MGKKSRIDGILSLQIGKKTNRWDFIFTDWKENKSMGFYLYRLERKQIDGILSLQIEKKQIQRQNNL